MSESSERLEQIGRQQADDYWVLVRHEVCAAYLGMQVIPVPYLEDAEHYDLLNVLLERSKDMGSHLFHHKTFYPVGPLSGILASLDSSNIQMMEERIKRSTKYQGDFNHEEMVIDEGMLKSIKLIVKNINKEVSLFLLKPRVLQVSQDVPWIYSVRSIYIVYEVLYSTNFQLLVTHNKLSQQFKTESRIPIGFLCKKFRLESSGMIGEELHMKKSPRGATFVNTRSMTCAAKVGQHHGAEGEACRTSSWSQRVSSFFRCILTECCLSDAVVPDSATARSREDQEMGSVDVSKAGSPPRPTAAWITRSSPLPLRTFSLISAHTSPTGRGSAVPQSAARRRHTSSARSLARHHTTLTSTASASQNTAETSTSRTTAASPFLPEMLVESAVPSQSIAVSLLVPRMAAEFTVSSQSSTESPLVPQTAAKSSVSSYSTAENSHLPHITDKSMNLPQFILDALPVEQPVAESAVLRQLADAPRRFADTAGAVPPAAGEEPRGSSVSPGGRAADRLSPSQQAAARSSCSPTSSSGSGSRSSLTGAPGRPPLRRDPQPGAMPLLHVDSSALLPAICDLISLMWAVVMPPGAASPPGEAPAAVTRPSCRPHPAQRGPSRAVPGPAARRFSPARKRPFPRPSPASSSSELEYCRLQLPPCPAAPRAAARPVASLPAPCAAIPRRGLLAGSPDSDGEENPGGHAAIPLSPVLPPRATALRNRVLELPPLAHCPSAWPVRATSGRRSLAALRLPSPGPGSCPWCGCAQTAQPRGVAVIPATQPRGVGVGELTQPRGVGVGELTQPRGVGVGELTQPRGVGVGELTQPRGVAVTPATQPRGVAVTPATQPRGVGVGELTQPRGVGVGELTQPRGVGVGELTQPRGVAVTPATESRGVAVTPATQPRGVAVTPATQPRGVGVGELTQPRGVAVTPATESRGVAVTPATQSRGVGADEMPDSCSWAATCPEPESPYNALKRMMPTSSDSEAEDRPTGSAAEPPGSAPGRRHVAGCKPASKNSLRFRK